MIAVTGATGTVGSELVRILSRRGEAVRALTRDPSSSPEVEGVEWVEADLARRKELTGVLEGAPLLFLLTGNGDDMVRLQTNALEAAGEAGVRRIVKLSALGATDHSRSVIGLWHWIVEQRLRSSELAWTILRPHHFMQNLLDPVTFDREAGEVRSASGEGRIPFIDARDVAAVAAETLVGEGHEGEVYTLTGPAARSYGEATRVLAGTLERPLVYRAESMEEAFRRRRAAGQPVWMVGAQLALAGYHRAGGPTARTTGTVERLTGRPPRTLEDFARDHGEALSG